MMPKRVFIVHGWGEQANKGWFPWLKKELEAKGFEANVPSMKPQPPILGKWKALLKKAVGKPDENTYFVGHSAGCQTILHYLAELPEGTKVGGVVLVAGWTDDLGIPELANFFAKPLDWTKARKCSERFFALYSDNDPYVKSYHAEELEDKLGAEATLVEGKKHFGQEDRVNKLPEVLNILLEIAK